MLALNAHSAGYRKCCTRSSRSSKLPAAAAATPTTTVVLPSAPVISPLQAPPARQLPQLLPTRPLNSRKQQQQPDCQGRQELLRGMQLSHQAPDRAQQQCRKQVQQLSNAAASAAVLVPAQVGAAAVANPNQIQATHIDILQRAAGVNSSHSRSASSTNHSSSSSSKMHALSQTLAVLRSSSSGGVSATAAARAAPHLLTSAITQCETVSEVQQVFSEMSGAFNNVHVAAMVSRLPKILRSYQQQQQQQQHGFLQRQQDSQQRQQSWHVSGSSSSSSSSMPITPTLTLAKQQDLQQLLQDLSQLSEELLPSCSPREMSNIAWGFAALGFYSRRLMQLLLGRCILGALKPQELSNLAWAAAKLGHDVPPDWVDELLLLSGRVLQSGRFKPQEAANTAWALAVVQRRCLLAAVPNLHSSCTRVDTAWKLGFCAAVTAQIGFWAAADISQALWALAVLGFSGVEQKWVDQVLIRGLQLLGEGRMQSRHAATMLWSVAKLQQQRQWAAAAGAVAGSDAHSSNGSAGNSSSGSGSSVVSSTVAVFAAAVAAKVPWLLAGEQQPLHFAAVLLSACQQLQLQPPAAAMDALLAAAASQLGSLDLTAAAAHSCPATDTGGSSSCGTIADCVAVADRSSDPRTSQHQQQQQQQQQSWQRRQQRQPHKELLLDLSMLLYSLAKLSFRPGQHFLELVADVVADRAWRVVDCHDALSTASTAWQELQHQHQQHQQQQQQQGSASGSAGVHVVGPHPAAVASQQQQALLLQRHLLLQELQSSMRGREVSLLLWAMGKLRYQAPMAVLRPIKMSSLRQREHFTAADISVTFWALARMRNASRPAWVRFMLRHFLSRIDDHVQGAAEVASVVHALPHLAGWASQRCHFREDLSTEVLQDLASAAASRFHNCGPRELVQLVQGFALLGYVPNSSWLTHFQQQLRAIGWQEFSIQEQSIVKASWKRLKAMQQQPAVQQQQQPAVHLPMAHGGQQQMMQQMVPGMHGAGNPSAEQQQLTAC